MTAFIDLLRSRRSIRMFSDEKIAETDLPLLREAVLRAPTSRGLNPWEFIFVDDPGLLQSLSTAKAKGSAFLAGAKLAVVICADEKRSDVWTEDCSIAAITLQYAAHDLSLGSCWVQIRNRLHDDTKTSEQFIRELFDLPEYIRVASVIGIGHPAESKAGHPFDSLPFQKLKNNTY